MAYLSFHFPWNVSAADAIKQVADHFAVSVAINGQPATIPAHIKQAVEGIGADNPVNGVETSAAVAFGGLLNGAGNAAPSSAAVATQPTAPVVSQDTSATLPPASSAPVPPAVNAAPAPVASAATVNPASNGVEFDSTGLAWDARIHSGAKSQTAKGEWRAMKGVDKSLVKNIELELRARYPGNVAPASSAVTTSAASLGDVHAASAIPSHELATKKAAALAFAHAEGIRVAGKQLLDDAQIDAMNNGKPVTCSPEANEWYMVYFAKRNAAYSEFMARPNVPAAPEAPQSGNAAAAPAGAITPGSAPTMAAGPLVDLDAVGLPHDARINIPAKLKDAAGVWLQRHDVAGEVKLAVMAELRAALAAPNGAAPVSSDPNGAVLSAPVVPQAVTAEQASAEFPKLMQWIVLNQLAKRITPTAGPDVALQLGFADPAGNGQLVLMREASTMWPYAVQLLQAQGAI